MQAIQLKIPEIPGENSNGTDMEIYENLA